MIDNIEKYIGRYHEGISNHDYHSIKEFLSSSQLKMGLASPATFKWYMENKGKDNSTWSPSYPSAKDFGSLVHTLLLEPHNVRSEFMFIDTKGVNFKTTEGKALKHKWIAAAKKANKILLTTADLERAQICRDSVMAHPYARSLMEGEGQAEVSGFFKDSVSGFYLRFRPDKLMSKLPIILDVKTTQDIEKFEEIAKWTFHYDLSAAMYLQGHQALTGQEYDFFFIVVESQAPYRTAVFKASPDFLKRGKRKFLTALDNVKIAMEGVFTPKAYQQADWELI